MLAIATIITIITHFQLNNLYMLFISHMINSKFCFSSTPIIYLQSPSRLMTLEEEKHTPVYYFSFTLMLLLHFTSLLTLLTPQVWGVSPCNFLGYHDSLQF